MNHLKLFFKASVLCSVIMLLSAWSNATQLNTNAHKVKHFSDSLNLDQFKGKLVVLNFWASWSKASRSENKNIVRIYEKYRKNPKIVFVSVSLDTDEKAWKSAVAEDGMSWQEHVCDLKKYASPIALQFNVKSLPLLFLIDKDGNTVKSAASMIDLEAVIDENLKN